MMFVVVGKESERRILIDHCRFEDSLVPVNHFLKASSALDDVCEFRRSCHCVSSLVVSLHFRFFCSARAELRGRCGNATELCWLPGLYSSTLKFIPADSFV